MMVPIVQTKDLDSNFFPNWITQFKAIGMNPLDPLCAAMNESGLYAWAHNRNGDATGLIQFMPDTLKNVVGYKGTWQDFIKLSATDQIPYVIRYYKGHASDCKSPGLCYVTTFLPALVKDAAAGGPSYILCQHGGKLGWAYDANPGFDHAKKGYITVQDLEDTIVKACSGARWDEILARYNEAYATLFPPDSMPAA